MTIIFWVIVSIVWILFLFGIKIEFNPFKISFSTPYLGVGVILMVIGFASAEYHLKIKTEKKTTKHIINNISEFTLDRFGKDGAIKFLEDYKDFIKNKKNN